MPLVINGEEHVTWIKCDRCNMWHVDDSVPSWKELCAYIKSLLVRNK